MFVGGFKPMVGKTIKQTLNGRGESIECQLDPELQKASENPQTGHFVSEDTFKQMFAKNSGSLPEQPVSEGMTWEDAWDQEAGGMTTSTKAHYTYVGKQTVDGKQLDKIAVKTEVSLTPGADAQVNEVTVDSQENTGEILFDNVAGRLHSAKTNQNLTMTASVAGMELAIKSTATSSMTMTPVK
jgi:hypothetical protein